MKDADLFAELAREVTVEILSRLPIRSIAYCKCVCKRWAELIGTDEFANSQISKSAPINVAILTRRRRVHNILDESAASCRFLHIDHHQNITQIQTIPSVYPRLQLLSAHGLLLIFDSRSFRLCNLITREYIQISAPHPPNPKYFPRWVCTGFGHNKVVRFVDNISQFFYRQPNPPDLQIVAARSECLIYTLGSTSTSSSASWRSVAMPILFSTLRRNDATFLNGNLHWLMMDLNASLGIACFDLESEAFTSFWAIPCKQPVFNYKTPLVCGFEGLLCVCEYGELRGSGRIEMWLMKEYGVESSWVEEFVIVINPEFSPFNHCLPLRLVKDGDILMIHCEALYLFYYSIKDKTCRRIQLDPAFEHQLVFGAQLHTPTSLSLISTFPTERVMVLP